MGREEGGGFRMGNTCIPVADSFWYLAKLIQFVKFKNKIKTGKKKKKPDWFDLLAVQGTFRSLLQHDSLKASILWCSAFFTVQLSQLYMTTGKTKALTIQTYVGKVMSLPVNTLSRFVIAFLPRSKHLLISWLQSPSSVILEPKKRKSFIASTFPPFN